MARHEVNSGALFDNAFYSHAFFTGRFSFRELRHLLQTSTWFLVSSSRAETHGEEYPSPGGLPRRARLSDKEETKSEAGRDVNDEPTERKARREKFGEILRYEITEIRANDCAE
jgi:hypothetical protein